ncbi:Hypothetical protein A7982_10092 [Minicystis rosea]|nr:Hypothetical protein A7982_10092 [Minicystis rosea]
MSTKELEAIRRARARRARVRSLLLAVTASVGLVTVALLFVFPGFSPFARRAPSAAPPSASAPTGDKAEGESLMIRVHDGVISLDGVALAKTAGIERVERVVPLYDALARRRAEGSASRSTRVVLSVDAAERAVVVKSVFQTTAFAGFPDIAFVLPDGSTVGPPR